MKFGVRAADAPKGESNGKFIKYFRKGEMTLRFLEEIDDWTVFYDHFSRSASRSFPCTGERDTCPGCTAENERDRSASRRYLVNAVDPETGYVDLWKVPVSIIDDLRRYSDKDGSITKRRYTVIQFKDSEGKAKYSVDREDRDNSPLSDYEDKMRDHEAALQEAYEEVWGELPDDEESPIAEASPKKGKKDKKEKKKARKPETMEDQVDAKLAAKAQGEEDDEPPFEDEDLADDEPEEPEPEEDEDEEDDEEINVSEEELNEMDAAELKSLFRKANFPVPRTSDTAILRERFLAAAGS